MAKPTPNARNSRPFSAPRLAPWRAAVCYAVVGMLALKLPAPGEVLVPRTTSFFAELTSAGSPVASWGSSVTDSGLGPVAFAVPRTAGFSGREVRSLDAAATLPVDPLVSEGAVFTRQMLALASLGLVGAGGLYSGLRTNRRRRGDSPPGETGGPRDPEPLETGPAAASPVAAGSTETGNFSALPLVQAPESKPDAGGEPGPSSHDGEESNPQDQWRRFEAQYRTLFPNSTDGLALIEVVSRGAGVAPAFRLLGVDASFEKLTGLRAEAEAGRERSEILPEETSRGLEPVVEALTQGQTHRFEGQVGPENRWFAITAVPQSPGRVAGVFVDITDRKHDEHARVSKVSELEAIFQQTPVIEFILDGQGSVRRANRAAFEHFGWEAGATGSYTLGQFIRCAEHCVDTGACGVGEECGTCPLRTAIDESQRNASIHRRVEFNKILKRREGDGAATLLVSTSPLQLGLETGVLVCMEDVTVVRLAEDRLLEQAALLAAAQEPICLLDLEGRIRFWNKGAEQLFGRAPVAVIDEEASEILFGGPSPEWSEAMQRMLNHGHWQGELHPVRRDGQRLTIEARGSLVRDTRGQPKSIMVMAVDLTEMKQLEQQFLRAQRLESLGTLACGIAHDLNNVLTPVGMVVDLLRPAVEGTKAERLLELLTGSAQRGADIIRQLLLFGRGSEGPRTELDLRYLMKEMAKIVTETFPRSIRVGHQLDEGLWPVLGDPTELHQVLLNLCVNARDAMAETGGTLTLAASNVELDAKAVRRLPQARPGRYVVFRVRDTGTGIPQEALDRIFDPFYTTKPVGQGTGLGLATVQGIVRRHEGFVQVTTEVGRGSEFAVYLPAGDEKANLVVPEVEIPPRPATETARLILVVDDEEAIRESIRSALECAGYQVLTAADGGEAISLFGRRQSEIAAVVIDMMMPFVDGPSAVALLRRLKPSVPILAVSGLPSQREEAEKAMDGKVVFLAKPFTVKALLRSLYRILDGDLPDPTSIRVPALPEAAGTPGNPQAEGDSRPTAS